MMTICQHVNVLLPSMLSKEQNYILNILLKEFLGLSFHTELYDGDYIEITVKDSNSRLTLNAGFFTNAEKTWLREGSMPVLPLQSWLPAEDGIEAKLVDEEIPVIFGEPGLLKKNNHWHLNVDVFGSAFFMLSRYEELITQDRDQHDRFPAAASVAYKANFLDRPIISEYVEILWECLHGLWPSLDRKKTLGKIYVSCDVDQPYDCSVETVKSMLRACAGDIVKRKNLFEALKRLNRYVFNKIGVYKFDRNYTFDWYLDACEEAGLKATFYIIPTSVEPGNGCYELSDKKTIKLIQKIDNRGHLIGVHGTYQTYQDSIKMRQQRSMLEQTLSSLNISQKTRGNRQHYLRWDSAVTPEGLNYAGFEYDSTGGYADYAGFRYGTAHEFPMWGWEAKTKLKLRQRPLIVMECSVISAVYMGLGLGESAAKYMEELKCRSLKYGGNFSLLWHNSSLESEQHKELFKKIIG